MKTLADLKRELRVGRTIQLVHLESAWTPPVRKINYVGSNQFGCLTINKEGKEVTSYCQLPKSKDLKIIDDKTFIIYSDWYKDGKEQYLPLLQYTFLD